MRKKFGYLICTLLAGCVNIKLSCAEPIGYSEENTSSIRTIRKAYSTKCGILVRYKTKGMGIWDVIQGDDCPLGHAILEETDYFGRELIGLLEHFDAISKLRESKTLRIFFNQREVNPLIVRAVNKADLWPRNIYKSLQEKYPSKKNDELSKSAMGEYREMLRQELNGPNGLGGLYIQLEKIGCKAKLSEWFIEFSPTRKDGFVTADEIVQSGLATKEQLKKELYPNIGFSAVTLSIQCQ